MAFGSREGPPCVPYVRAVILHLGNYWGMLILMIFGGVQFPWGGWPPPNFPWGMKYLGGYPPPWNEPTGRTHRVMVMFVFLWYVLVQEFTKNSPTMRSVGVPRIRSDLWSPKSHASADGKEGHTTWWPGHGESNENETLPCSTNHQKHIEAKNNLFLHWIIVPHFCTMCC